MVGFLATADTRLGTTRRRGCRSMHGSAIAHACRSRPRRRAAGGGADGHGRGVHGRAIPPDADQVRGAAVGARLYVEGESRGKGGKETHLDHRARATREERGPLARPRDGCSGRRVLLRAARGAMAASVLAWETAVINKEFSQIGMGDLFRPSIKSPNRTDIGQKPNLFLVLSSACSPSQSPSSKHILSGQAPCRA